MKVTKIPGCGSYGVFIDGVDFNHITDDEWMEIGKIHLKEMVTIIRDTKLKDVSTYTRFMKKWGRDRFSTTAIFFERYPDWDGTAQMALTDPKWSEDDRMCIKEFINVKEHNNTEQGDVLKVTGDKDKDGNPLGMFAEGELLWHSNESGNIAFSPGVALLGFRGTTKSSTGFLTTVDYYESVSESFRSELDDMIAIHNFTPGKINPGLRDIQDNVMYKNMAPHENEEIPMVITSPGGHKGLHYSFNTVTGIKGMSQIEADKLLEQIRKDLCVDEYIYDHWYEQDGDLCLFDNSITQHRRQGSTDGRLCYRYQYDYTALQDGPWMTYKQQPYIDRYIDTITRYVKVIGIDHFHLPKKEDYNES
jgi:alpha-ketoglutarate-dependent taurine dioxygenase